jgi:hypothetical protein
VTSPVQAETGYAEDAADELPFMPEQPEAPAPGTAPRFGATQASGATQDPSAEGFRRGLAAQSGVQNAVRNNLGGQ